MERPLFLFTTELLNKAADGVRNGQFVTLVDFHKSLDDTKRLLANPSNCKSSPVKLSQQPLSVGSRIACYPPSPFADVLTANSNPVSPRMVVGSMSSNCNSISTPPLPASTIANSRSHTAKAPPINVKLETGSPVSGQAAVSNHHSMAFFPSGPPSVGPIAPHLSHHQLGYKRDFSQMMMHNDPGPVNMPAIVPYGLDTSNLPITDTHYGHFPTNGDPLEKMAKLTQEALPFEPSQKQPKLENSSSSSTSEASGCSKSGLVHGNSTKFSENSHQFSFASGSTYGNSAEMIVSSAASSGSNLLSKSSIVSGASSSSSTTTIDEDLTPSQRQHRQDSLQRLESLRVSLSGKSNQQQQQPMQQPHQHLSSSGQPFGGPVNFMHGMSCGPTGISIENGMFGLPPGSSIPPHFGPGMIHPTGPMLSMPSPGLMIPDQRNMLPPAVEQKVPKSVKNSTRASTPKASSVAARNAVQQPMMVQGKPAVMVPPNQNAKSSRHSSSRAAASSEKRPPPPPNVAFIGVPSMPGVSGLYLDQQQSSLYCSTMAPPHGNGSVRFGGMPASSMAGGSAPSGVGSSRFRVPSLPSNVPNQQQPPLQTASGGGGPNLNLNVNLQISASDVMRPPSSQMQPSMCMGFYGQQPGCGSGDFPLAPGMGDSDDMFNDMFRGPPNVNIAVTGDLFSQNDPCNGQYFFGNDDPSASQQSFGFNNSSSSVNGPQLQGPSDPTRTHFNGRSSQRECNFQQQKSKAAMSSSDSFFQQQPPQPSIPKLGPTSGSTTSSSASFNATMSIQHMINSGPNIYPNAPPNVQMMPPIQQQTVGFYGSPQRQSFQQLGSKLPLNTPTKAGGLPPSSFSQQLPLPMQQQPFGDFHDFSAPFDQPDGIFPTFQNSMNDGSNNNQPNAQF